MKRADIWNRTPIIWFVIFIFHLFYISKTIPRKTLNPEGGFVALLHVIEEQTKLNMNAFYQDNLAISAYFEADEITRIFLNAGIGRCLFKKN